MSEKGAEQLLKIRAIVSKLLCGPEPLLETRTVRGSKITRHYEAMAKTCVFFYRNGAQLGRKF